MAKVWAGTLSVIWDRTLNSQCLARRVIWAEAAQCLALYHTKSLTNDSPCRVEECVHVCVWDSLWIAAQYNYGLDFGAQEAWCVWGTVMDGDLNHTLPIRAACSQEPTNGSSRSRGCRGRGPPGNNGWVGKKKNPAFHTGLHTQIHTWILNTNIRSKSAPWSGSRHQVELQHVVLMAVIYQCEWTSHLQNAFSLPSC